MLHLLMTIVGSWWVIPRACRLSDRRLCRKRSGLIVRESLAVSPGSVRRLSDVNGAEIFESLSMMIRSGINSREALEQLARDNRLPSDMASMLFHNPDVPLRQLLDQFRQHCAPSSSRVAQLLSMSYRHGSLDPSALDAAARRVRDDELHTSRIVVATAQARITTRILTGLPVALLVLGCCLSSTVRSVLQQPGVLVFVFIGFVFDAAGLVWMRAISRSVTAQSRPTPLHELMASTAFSLQSGDSLMAAIEQWSAVNSVGARVSQELTAGSSLSDSLRVLHDECGERGHMVRRLLLDNHQAGTPAAHIVSQLQNDIENDISRITNTGLQQLTTKLTLPIVFCVLPAFLSLALMPVAVASMGALPSPSLQ